jgi:predicted phosphodiesterase
MPSEMARFAAISCVHVGPASSDREQALEWLLGLLEDHQKENGRLTHFVLLGDLFDAQAASIHPRDDQASWTLDDEYEQGAQYLRSIRERLDKGCKLVWTLGNHDDNIRVSDARRIPWDIRPLCDWNQYPTFGEEFRRWQQVPYQKPSIHNRKGCYEVGQVIFCHGFDAGANSDELEGLQINYALGGHSWRLAIRGHTHRPKDVTQGKRSARVLLPFHYANVGTMGPLMPQYMVRKDTSQWGAGLALGEAKIGRIGRMNGKCWDAQVVIRD